MSELRWILIGFGIVLLAAIYLWGRRGNRAVVSDDATLRARPEPTMYQAEVTLERAVDETPPAQPMQETAPASDSFPDEQEAAADTYEAWRGRVEPTFADAPTEELPVHPPASPSAAPPAAAPTLSSSEAPQARRVERRKILSVRIAMVPQRVEGAKLLESLQAESLQHGKYSIFHRLHTDGSVVFSVASMVEPGTFDLEKMGET